jgi:hypothetical protein
MRQMFVMIGLDYRSDIDSKDNGTRDVNIWLCQHYCATSKIGRKSR